MNHHRATDHNHSVLFTFAQTPNGTDKNHGVPNGHIAKKIKKICQQQNSKRGELK